MTLAGTAEHASSFCTSSAAHSFALSSYRGSQVRTQRQWPRKCFPSTPSTKFSQKSPSILAMTKCSEVVPHKEIWSVSLSRLTHTLRNCDRPSSSSNETAFHNITQYRTEKANMAENTYHMTSEDVRKMEAQESKFHGGSIPKDSDTAAMKVWVLSSSSTARPQGCLASAVMHSPTLLLPYPY